MDIFREIGGVFQQVVSMSLTAGLVILAICAARLLLRQAPKKKKRSVPARVRAEKRGADRGGP